MRNYFFLLLFTTTTLGISTQLKWHKVPVKDRKVPTFLWKYMNESKAGFQKAENANLFSAFLFGSQAGISPHTREAFKKTNLSFLLKPSGVHLNSFFLILAFLLKKRWIKIYQLIHWSVLIGIFISPAADNLKRLSLLRLGHKLRYQFKQKWRSEIILIFLFVLAFILGHFFDNPYSFVLSLLYIGTFFFLSTETKTILILSLFMNSIVSGLFLGTKVSLLSVITSLAGVSLFSLIHPLFIIYFLSWKLIPFNWIEHVLNIFVAIVKLASKLTHGSFTSSSLFLALAIGILIFNRRNNSFLFTFTLCLFLHSNTAMTPCLFRS